MGIRESETAVERCRAAALSFGAKDHADALRDAIACLQELRHFASMSRNATAGESSDLEARLLEFARSL